MSSGRTGLFWGRGIEPEDLTTKDTKDTKKKRKMNTVTHLKLIGLSLVVFLSIGCPYLGEENFTRNKPDPVQLSGRYSLSAFHSQCPLENKKACLSPASIIIDQNGTFEFSNVPPCFGSEGGCFDNRLNLKGRWSLVNRDKKWLLQFDFKDYSAQAMMLHQSPPYQIFFDLASDPDYSTRITYIRE